jgi:hypothetical protein
LGEIERILTMTEEEINKQFDELHIKARKRQKK